MGELHYFLGVNVKQNLETGKIWIGQSFYALTVLKKFGLKNCKPAATPVATGTKLLSLKIHNFLTPLCTNLQWVCCYIFQDGPDQTSHLLLAMLLQTNQRALGGS